MVGADEDRAKNALGYHWLLPKEYFVADANVAVGFLGQDLGRGLAHDIEQRALSRFIEQVPLGQSSTVVDDVDRALQQLRKAGYNPSIVLLGSWEAYMDLYPQLAHSHDIRGTSVGEYRAAPVYNLHFQTGGVIIVGDLVRMGEWRQYRVAPSWDHEELLKGELGFSLVAITRENLAEFLEGVEPKKAPEKTEDVLQKAKFRLSANAEYVLVDKDALRCFRRTAVDAKPVKSMA